MGLTQKSQCPECAKLGRDRHKDNLVTYEEDGHKYCFSCGYHVPGTKSGYVRKEREENKLAKHYDWVQELPEPNNQWLWKYGLSATERALFKYSPSLDRHIYPVYNDDNEVSFFEARSVREDATPKSLIFGEKILHIRQSFDPRLSLESAKELTVVEDIVSAIKVARHIPTLPLFGSSLNKDHILHLLPKVNRLNLWLDYDKYTKVMEYARLAKMLGINNVRIINTKKDPKEYNDSEIENKLNL